jgi:hypothetical protein
MLEAANTGFRMAVPCRAETATTLQPTGKKQIKEIMELLCHYQQLHCRCQKTEKELTATNLFMFIYY